jgi:hypothetical protein
MEAIKAEKIKIVPLKDLKPNPLNRNKHPPEQIVRLIEIIRYQGFRNPIVVSNRSGLVVTGHGRLEAARAMGLERVPVIFQDYEDEDQEYAHAISDNAISMWAELDTAGINEDLARMGREFSLEQLGMRSFTQEIPGMPGGGHSELRDDLPNVDIQGSVNNRTEILVITFADPEKYAEVQRQLGLRPTQRTITYTEIVDKWELPT